LCVVVVRDIGQGGSGSSGYSWVGVCVLLSLSLRGYGLMIECRAYLLTSTCLIPVYGKVSNIYGRKPVLYFSIIVFLLYVPPFSCPRRLD
jgi:MFS family permease